MASDLTEDQKLVMLGLRSPNQQATAFEGAFVTLQNNIASDWDEFQELYEDASIASFDDFETWLTNNGISSADASNIRSQFESKFSFADFDSTLLGSTSWEDFKSNFRVGSGLRSELKTEDGLSIGGVQVYEEGGIGRAGQSIAAGGVEVYGTEVHFSQSAAVGGEQTPAEDQSANPITYSNLSVSDTTPVPFEDIDVSATVTNNTNIPGFGVVAELQVDGEVRSKKTITVPANSSTTVTFTTDFSEYASYEVTIGDLSPETVVVIHPNLIP